MKSKIYSRHNMQLDDGKWHCLFQIQMSVNVISDLDARILNDVRDERPGAIIVVPSWGNWNWKHTVATVYVNLEGLQCLHRECVVTTENYRGEYYSDTRDSEARAEYKRWFNASTKLEQLLNTIKENQEESW